MPPTGNLKLVSTLSEPLTSTFLFNETSLPTTSLLFKETSPTKLVVVPTNNFLFNETSPFTSNRKFKDASPKIETLEALFESTTFLSIEVVFAKS